MVAAGAARRKALPLTFRRPTDTIEDLMRRALIFFAVTLLSSALARAGDAPSVRVEAPRDRVPVPISGEGRAELAIVVADGYHVYGKNDKDYIPLAIAGTMATIRVGASLPEPKVEEILGEKVPVYEGRVLARLAVRIEGGHAVGEKLDVPVEVSYQACNKDFCEAPAKIAVAIPIEVVAKGAEPPAGGTLGAPPAAPGGGLLEILGALAAGLGVTLTPCVYPLIPVTVTYFQQQAGGRRARAVPLAIAYGLGIVIMYAALGIAAARLGRDLGAILGKPWVGVGFAVLFTAFAASMFGLFDIALPSSVATRLQSGERSGAFGALLLGLTLGLVAAPCTGPVAGGLIVLVATTGNVLFGLAAFGAFGLGIALPFMALGIFSSSLGALPRAGAWMQTVKHVFGFLLLGFAIYFIDVAFGSERADYALFGVLLLAAGASAALGAAKRLRARRVVFGLASAAAALVLLPIGAWLLAGPYVPALAALVRPPQDRFAPKIPWEYDHDKALEEARAAGKPAFIDFTARWCLPCRKLDRTTFLDDAVVAEARRFVAVKVDITDDLAAQKLKRELYGSANVPFIAFYDSRGNRLDDKAFAAEPTTEEFLARLREIH
jgi:thiol:disulfide interchange protein DsbD